jgi:hypothetical protein
LGIIKSLVIGNWALGIGQTGHWPNRALGINYDRLQRTKNLQIKTKNQKPKTKK